MSREENRMKTVWQMIKLKVINNRKLWICCLCIVATTLLCFLSPFPGGDPDVKETVLKIWLSNDREQLLQMDEMASIYSVAVGFRNMEWFIVMLPLVAVIPGIFEFSEVWFGGNFYLTALRGTKKQFARKWLLESAWKAFLCVGSGIVFYIVLVAIKFLPLDAYVNDASESMIAMVYGETLLLRTGWLLLALVFGIWNDESWNAGACDDDWCAADAGIFAGDTSDFVSVSAIRAEKTGITDRCGNYGGWCYGGFLYETHKMGISTYTCN